MPPIPSPHTPFSLSTPDRVELGATLTSARPPLERHRGRATVVIAGATAVPHRYYRPLARWIAETLDVRVLSFDYRGIGASRTGDLRGHPATYPDWADDLRTAVRWAAERGDVVVVGHSFGGHAFGMTDAHQQTRGLYTFATGAGWHGWMAPAERARVWALWNLLAPPLVGWHGYLPFSSLGMGEDLPLGVYRDWKRWCRHPGYFFDDPVEGPEWTRRFEQVTVPVTGVNSTDDAWAPPRSAKAFLSHYPRVRCETIEPAQLGLNAIGHMQYVRPRCRDLWTPMAEWIDARLQSTADRRAS